MKSQQCQCGRPQFGVALLLTVLLAGCGGQPASPTAAATAASSGAPAVDGDKVVNVYNWSDYIDPSVIPAFEQATGIKVNYDVFDSNEVVETKLLAGHTGYDVVVPSGSFLKRQILAGVYQKLDKAQLPNLKNEDPEVSRLLQTYDPGNQYGVNYLWGTSGVGYNESKIQSAMPNAPVDSFAMFYDPKVIKNFQQCGVSILDAPDEVLGTVLLYLGKDPASEAADDLAAAEKVLLSIRPYVRYINSSKYIDDLANGDICLALGWSGDVGQARLRATQAGKTYRILYHLPKEGAVSFFDMMAIPADAPHPNNAHLFINFMLQPEIAAKNSSAMRYATSNAAAYSLIDPAVYGDHALFPRGADLAQTHPNAVRSQSYTRELNRVWTRFKTGT